MTEEALKLIKDFQERNFIVISITFHDDGSGTVNEFLNEEYELKEFQSLDELNNFLINE